MPLDGVALCCPVCRASLDWSNDSDEISCGNCGRVFPVLFGIPDVRVFPDPYIDIESDRAKGLRVAEHFDRMDFAELVDYYYGMTPAVPAGDARRYTRGLMAAEARANTALDAWGVSETGEPGITSLDLLEVGCGTGPLLVAASERFRTLVGVDIAFRWLVIAKKRLLEAGVDMPLICGCAEALPFPDRSFDLVVGDSVLEHLRDQAKGLGESFRVLRPGGRLFLTTPNRYSLGPDPHAGVWAGGFLPQRWLAAYVRRKGGVPPRRNLVSIRRLGRLIRRAGYDRPNVTLPDVSREQRSYFGPLMRVLVTVYQIAIRLPFSRRVLYTIGPLFHATATKPTGPAGRHESSQFEPANGPQ